jgi:hypothetical protein
VNFDGDGKNKEMKMFFTFVIIFVLDSSISIPSVINVNTKKILLPSGECALHSCLTTIK